MRRTIIILPGAMSEEAFRQKLPTLQTMAELGRVFKLTPMPVIETPEAIWLGMKPEEAQLRQGPLTVAALGADPPERSTHFHVTPMSLNGDTVSELVYDVPAEELQVVLGAAERLNTKTLTFIPGENLDHGLVWEGLGEMETAPPPGAARDGFRASLPYGDAENLLRRFVDDSVNLLAESEFNLRRIDEGLPPINLLWPWGHGVRLKVPNLALRRGEPAMVMSASLRLAGLSRLAGYRHSERKSFGRGTNTRLSEVGVASLSEALSIVLMEAPGELGARGQVEELHWLVREIDDRLLKPLFEKALTQQARITLLVTGALPEVGAMVGGIGLQFQTGDQTGNAIPFDERALEEKLPTFAAWEAIDQATELPALHTTPC